MMNKSIYIYANSLDFIIEDNTTNEIVAYVVPNADKISWRLVKVNEDIPVYVNGVQVHLVHYLNFGDKIKVVDDNQQYIFEKKKENSDNEIKNSLSKLKLSIVAIFTFMTVIVVCLLIKINVINEEDDIMKSEVMKYESSVFKVVIKDVYYQEVHKNEKGLFVKTLDSMAFNEEIPSGSAFLCEDGKFVTARHCIEPWITSTNPDSAYAQDKCVKWAADALTFNIMNHKKNNDSIYRRIETKFIANNSDTSYVFSSDSCYYYMDNDILVNLKMPQSTPLYWSYLGEYDKKSSLGDIVFFKTNIKGNIKIADDLLIDSLKIDHPVVHLGYLAKEHKFDFERSRLSEAYSNDRCMKHKNTDVDKGFSGGPALVRHKGELCAIGVLSRRKEVGGRICYCVPITMIQKSKQIWIE